MSQCPCILSSGINIGKICGRQPKPSSNFCHYHQNCKKMSVAGPTSVETIKVKPKTNVPLGSIDPSPKPVTVIKVKPGPKPGINEPKISPRVRDKLTRLIKNKRINTSLPWLSQQHEQACANNGEQDYVEDKIVSVKYNLPILTLTSNLIPTLAKITLGSARQPVPFLWTDGTINQNIAFNNYTEPLMKRVYLGDASDQANIPQGNTDFISKPSDNWVMRQAEYLKSLNFLDVYTAMSATNHTHFWLNPYFIKEKNAWWDDLQNFLSRFARYPFPLFAQYLQHLHGFGKQYDDNVPLSVIYLDMIDNMKNMRQKSNIALWEHLCNLYLVQIQRIIKDSPAVDIGFNVYRGITDNYHRKTSGQPFSQTNIYTTPVITSTSILANYAIGYTRSYNCCFKRIHIPKDCRVLCMFGISLFPHEMEILLPSWLSLKMKGHYHTSVFKHNDDYVTDICYKNITKVITTDIEVIPDI